jgi:hypothetical protein
MASSAPWLIYSVLSYSVLSNLTKLSTITGDIATARKKTRELRPVTLKERAWLEAVIPEIIRTMATQAAKGTAPRLDMSQLPRL